MQAGRRQFLAVLVAATAIYGLDRLTFGGDEAKAPVVAVEAWGLDRRIVVASSNPILRLALSLPNADAQREYARRSRQ